MKLDNRLMIGFAVVALLLSMSIGFVCLPDRTEKPKTVPYQPSEEDLTKEQAAADAPVRDRETTESQPARSRRTDAPVDTATEDPAKPKKPVKPPKAGAG